MITKKLKNITFIIPRSASLIFACYLYGYIISEFLDSALSNPYVLALIPIINFIYFFYKKENNSFHNGYVMSFINDYIMISLKNFTNLFISILLPILYYDEITNAISLISASHILEKAIEPAISANTYVSAIFILI